MYEDSNISSNCIRFCFLKTINTVDPLSTGTYDVRLNGQTGTLPSNVWETQIVGEAGTTVQTSALCFDNPPPH